MRSRTRSTSAILAALVAAATASFGLTACADGPAERAGSSADDPHAPATRVVSLIPAATEIVFAIGAGDRLVGRTRWDVHPPEARLVPDVGDGIRPSPETVLAREPDLVVLASGSDNRGVAARLEALGVRTLSLAHNTLDDLERNILALGAALGCRGSAAALVGRIRTGLASVAESRTGAPRRVYYDVWADPPMTIGRGSYLDSLLTIAGAENVFGDLAPPSPQVSLEAIVRADPDLVLYSMSGGGAPPHERAGWEHIPAVAAGRVSGVDGDLVNRLGPRLPAAALELARAIHPERPLGEWPAGAQPTSAPARCVP